MPKPLKMLSALAMSVALAMPAAAQDTPDVDQVVATVNGEDITLGHMILVYAGLPDEYKQLPAPTLWEGILQQMVQQTVMSQAEDAEETKRVQLAMDNERRALLSSELIAKMADEGIPEEELRAAYEELIATSEAETEYNASHILVETEEEAQAIVAQLAEGADFAALARKESTGPSGPSGGTLGWFGPGMMVAPFQEAVEAMEPGTISAPVQTQFGWHVIRLNESRNSAAPEFDEVREELSTQLIQDRVRARIDQEVQQADINVIEAVDIDPSVLSQLELLSN